MDQGKWHSLHKAPFCPHRQMNFSRGKIHLGYAIFLDKLSRYGIKVMEELFGNYGATYTRVSSQTSNNRNIPFNRKRNVWLGYFGGKAEVDQWNGIGKGWDQGVLEHGKEICSSSSPTRCSRTKTATKTRKTEKKKKLRKPGCHSGLVRHLKRDICRN